jgi:putative two-component system response regulator
VGNETILVVDDSRVERKIIRDYLIPQGYDIIEAPTIKSALQLMAEKKPDLIILDLILEDGNGLDLCKTLKQDSDTLKIPIIMITGHNEKNARIQGLESGADEFLIKPVDRGELLARAKSLLKIKGYYEYMLMKDHYEQLEGLVQERTFQLKRTLEKLQSANEHISDAYKDSLYRLSIAAEYRDDDTAGHIKRIRLYCDVIGEQLGLNSKFREIMYATSALHDVGKIGIPDSILLKPGKLNKEEWDIMRRHTTIGSKILGGANNIFLQTAETIALTHHEKYDGSGYPCGLRGEHIPLEGRIVAVADVFDALTSKRVYKPIYSIDDSLRIIKEGSGTHFDANVVEAMFKRVVEIRDIRAASEQEYFINKIV